MENLEDAEVLEVYDSNKPYHMNSAEIEMLPLKSTLDSEGDSVVDENEPWTLQNWLYPPDLPRACQLLRKENIGRIVALVLGLICIIILNDLRKH